MPKPQTTHFPFDSFSTLLLLYYQHFLFFTYHLTVWCWSPWARVNVDTWDTHVHTLTATQFIFLFFYLCLKCSSYACKWQKCNDSLPVTSLCCTLNWDTGRHDVLRLWWYVHCQGQNTHSLSIYQFLSSLFVRLVWCFYAFVSYFSLNLLSTGSGYDFLRGLTCFISLSVSATSFSFR